MPPQEHHLMVAPVLDFWVVLPSCSWDHLRESTRMAGQFCKSQVSIVHGGSRVGVRGWLGSSLVVGTTLH